MSAPDFSRLTGAADVPAAEEQTPLPEPLAEVSERMTAAGLAGEETAPEPSEIRAWEWDDADALSAPLERRKWLVEGLWPAGSYGVFAGAKKTLKSYNVLLLAVAVASDRKYLGRFEVDHGDVVYMAAEGGRDQFRQRFQEVCHGYGLMGKARKDVRFHATNNRAALGSEEFRANIRAALEQWSPKLLVLDSLYNIHAHGVETANLYQRGEMLAEVSDMVREISGGACSLIIVDHFKKATGALDLHNISMAGVAEWVDSWVLLRLRKPFDLDRKHAALEVQFGNRHRGAEYAIDVTLPPDPEEANDRVGAVTWTVRPLSEAEAEEGDNRRQSAAVTLRQSIEVHLMKAGPDGRTRPELKKVLRESGTCSSDAFLEATKALLSEGLVTEEKVDRGGRQRVLALVWRPGPVPVGLAQDEEAP